MFSVIIISYERPIETLACVNSILKYCDSDLIGEIIVINNSSNKSYLCFEDGIVDISKVKYIVSDSNLGVAGGRNLGVSVSNFDYLFFIDDDAEVADDILTSAKHIYDSHVAADILAVFSFDYYTKAINLHEFPCHDESVARESGFFTTHFIGVGHFIKKSVFNRVGLYPDYFIYGMEEYDLSARCLIHDIGIYASSDLNVFHKKALSGRLPRNNISMLLSINKIEIAYKYFPFLIFISYFCLWTARYFVLSNGRGFLRFFSTLFQRLSSVSRSDYRKITFRKLRYVAKLGNHIFF